MTLHGCCAVSLRREARAAASEGVARVLGAEITRAELEAAGDEPARVARFRDWVWERVYGHYIAEQGLSATAGEIAELLAYHREFERKDRLQRARKLEELNGRLAGGDLEADERARLEEFRRVLIRMAERDAESERAAAGRRRGGRRLRALDRVLEGERGALPEVRRDGRGDDGRPAAHGARAALIADYERRGLVQFLDRAPARAALRADVPSARRIVPPERVDFTPYWKLPIPPSYFPD